MISIGSEEADTLSPERGESVSESLSKAAFKRAERGSGWGRAIILPPGAYELGRRRAWGLKARGLKEQTAPLAKGGRKPPRAPERSLGGRSPSP
jgi:hypothetical protein